MHSFDTAIVSSILAFATFGILSACGGLDSGIGDGQNGTVTEDAGTDGRTTKSEGGAQDEVEICPLGLAETTVPVKIGEATAWALEATGGHVYWSSIGQGVYGSDGEIGVLSRCGTSSRRIARNQIAPYGLSASGSTVCWANLGMTVDGRYNQDGSVHCKTRSGLIDIVNDAFERPYQIAIAGNDVFYSTWGIQRSNLQGAEPTLVTEFGTGDSVSLAVDDENVYIGSYGDLVAVPRTGTGKESEKRTLVADTRGFRDITSHGDSLYLNGWRNDDEQGIYRLAKTGGDLKRLVVTTDAGNRISADDQHVYYVDEGAVRRVSIDGGEPEILASPAGAYALTTDDTYVFWGSGGTVYRLRKHAP